MTRTCGALGDRCTLCCKLLPMKREKSHHFDDTIARMIEAGLVTRQEFSRWVPDFDKPAGEKCPHQRHHKGCNVYDRRPFGCRYWKCRWLTNDDTAELGRPDRTHYVIDVFADYVTGTEDGQEPVNIPVIQVWVDPRYPFAYRAPALRAYLDRRGKEGYAALIRYSATDGFVLFPPSMTNTGEWIEGQRTETARAEHSFVEKVIAIGEKADVKL